MRARERSYRCVVCRWQGQLELQDAGDAAPCPQCGVYLYPLSWAQTWGVVLAIVLTVLALVAGAVLVLREGLPTEGAVNATVP